MEDTSPEIRKQQHAIFFALPFDERIRLGMEMIISGIEIMENSIRLQHKGISEKDLIIEKIKRLYKNDFSIEEMERIVKHFKERR